MKKKIILPTVAPSVVDVIQEEEEYETLIKEEP